MLKRPLIRHFLFFRVHAPRKRGFSLVCGKKIVPLMVFGVFPQSDGERFCKVKRSGNVCKKSVSAEIYRKHTLLKQYFGRIRPKTNSCPRWLLPSRYKILDYILADDTKPKKT